MSATKKYYQTAAPQKEEKPVTKKTTVVNQTDTTIAKAEIERMKRLLTEKIKDPALAKKAAMIISDMLKK